MALASPASAALRAVGPVDPTTGFPAFYTDANGLSLQPCLDGPPLCVATPADLQPPAGEGFYALADATAGPFALREAVEAAYLAGDAVTFMRTQVANPKTALAFNATYTVTDPYGTFDCTTNATGFIPKNGCRIETVPGGPPFTAAMAGRIDSFLTWDTFGTPTGAPAAGYIGDGVTAHRVTGSPTGYNGFRVQGPGLTGTCDGGATKNCVETDLFTVQGKVQPGGKVASLSGGPLKFGDVPTTPAVTKTLTYTNLGDTAVTISDIAKTGTGAPAFAVTNNCGALPATVAVGGQCTIDVTFTPDPGNSSAATLTVTDDTAVGTRSVAVSGSNLPDMIVAAPVPPTGLSFGNLAVRTTSTEKLVTIGNDGKGPLTGVTASIAGFNADQYKVGSTNTCAAATVAAGGSCRIGVQFAPTFEGPADSANLKVVDATGKTVTVSLTGTGTAAVAAPTAVSLGTLTPGDGQVTVRWTGGTNATGYTVNAFVGQGTTVATSVTAAAGATSAVVGGLTNGTGYTFVVDATNSGGTTSSARSALVTPSAPVTAPGAPTIGTATAGNASATVNWTAPTTGGAPASYTVQGFAGGATTASVTQTVPAPASSLNVTGLTNGTSYQFKVVATNGGGSAASALSNAVTPAAPVTVTAPGAPTNVTATAGNAQATVSWVAPTNTGGAPLSEYRVQVRTGTTVVRTVTGITPTASTTVVTGLTNGTAYKFRVRALNSGTTALGTLSLPSNTVTPSAGTTNPAPTVTGRTPAINATGVSRTANITATFSEAVTGVTGTTFQVKNATTGTVVTAPAPTLSGTVANRWILNPTNALAANTKYTVTLTGGTTAIRDTAGAPLVTVTWSFTTGAV